MLFLGPLRTYHLETTDLRRNANYVQYYSLIGSGLVMVFVPFATLFLAYASIHRSMVAGLQRKKTLRLMTFIISLFLLCHLPKVYVITYSERNMKFYRP